MRPQQSVYKTNSGLETKACYVSVCQQAAGKTGSVFTTDCTVYRLHITRATPCRQHLMPFKNSLKTKTNQSNV